MGMQVGGDDEEVISTINTTPLVDVMLVLLIIFLIAIPVAIQTVPVELPKASSETNETKPENITIAVDADGSYFWNALALSDKEELLGRIKELAALDPQPEIQVRGDEGVAFKYIGQLIVLCQRAGIYKIGFVTEPVRAS